MKKVKALLAAGAMTGIILATVVGLSARNVAQAVSAGSAPAQTTTLTTNNQPNGFFESEHDEHQGGNWFSDN